MMGERGPGEETAELPAVLSADWSWPVLVVALVVGLAFLGGAYYGSADRRRAAGVQPGTGPRATQPGAGDAQSQAPAALEEEEAPTDGYFVGATLSEKRPGRAPLALPGSAGRVYYHYSLPGWPAGARVRLTWRLGGKELLSRGVKWQPDKRAPWATGYFLLPVPREGEGFPSGIYEVELSAEGGLTDTGSFAVLRDLELMMGHEPPAGAVLVSRPVICLSVDGQGRPGTPVTQVPATSPRVFTCFSYDGAVKGAVLEVVWFCQDVEVPSARTRLELPGVGGTASAFLRRGQEALPAGPWSVGVYLEGASQALSAASFTVVAPAAGKAEPRGAASP